MNKLSSISPEIKHLPRMTSFLDAHKGADGPVTSRDQFTNPSSFPHHRYYNRSTAQERLRLQWVGEKNRSLDLNRRWASIEAMAARGERAQTSLALAQYRLELRSSHLPPRVIAEAFTRLLDFYRRYETAWYSIEDPNRVILANQGFSEAEILSRYPQVRSLCDDIAVFASSLAMVDFTDLVPGLLEASLTHGFGGSSGLEALLDVVCRRLPELEETDRWGFAHGIATILAVTRMSHNNPRDNDSFLREAEKSIWVSWADTYQFSPHSDLVHHYAQNMARFIDGRLREVTEEGAFLQVCRDSGMNPAVIQGITRSEEALIHNHIQADLNRTFFVLELIARSHQDRDGVCQTSFGHWDLISDPSRRFSAQVQALKTALHHFLDGQPSNYSPQSWSILMTDLRNYHAGRAEEGHTASSDVLRLIDSFGGSLARMTAHDGSDVATPVLNAFWNLDREPRNVMQALDAWMDKDAAWGFSRASRGLGENGSTIQVLALSFVSTLPTGNPIIRNEAIEWQQGLRGRDADGHTMRQVLTRETMTMVAIFITTAIAMSLTGGLVAGAVTAVSENLALRIATTAVARQLVATAAASGEVLEMAEALAIAEQAAQMMGTLSFVSGHAGALLVYGVGFGLGQVTDSFVGNVTGNMMSDLRHSHTRRFTWRGVATSGTTRTLTRLFGGRSLKVGPVDLTTPGRRLANDYMNERFARAL